MPSNKKPRKAYVKRIERDWHYVTEERSKIGEDGAVSIEISYRIAFECILRGEAKEADLDTVICCLNTGMVLCEKGLGAEYMDTFLLALEAVFRAQKRGKALGIWRLDGNGIREVTAALEVHDEQIRMVKKHEMRYAIFEVRRRLNKGHVYK